MMAGKTSKTKAKRLSKGQRTHIRRLKQAARKAGIAYTASPAAGIKPVVQPRSSMLISHTADSA